MVTIWTQEYAKKPKQEVLKEQELTAKEIKAALESVTKSEGVQEQADRLLEIQKERSDLIEGLQAKTPETPKDGDKEPQDPLEIIKGLPFKDLRKVAIEQKVEGWQKMKQPELIAAIEKKIAEAQEDFTDDEEMPFDDEPGEDVPY